MVQWLLHPCDVDGGRDLAGMKPWLATWATPLTDVCSRRASRWAGCRAGGIVSKLLGMFPAFTNTFIPTRAGICHFLFLVAGSLEATGPLTQAHFVKFVLTIPLPQKSPHCMESPVFSVKWVKGSRSACCRFSCTHLSVIVVTSLPVSTNAFTSLLLICTSTVGHHPLVSLLGWKSWSSAGPWAVKSCSTLTMVHDGVVLMALLLFIPSPSFAVMLEVAWIPAPMTDWLHSWWGLC